MSTTQPAEDELIPRCREGDERAFEILYQRYRLPLFSYLHRLLPGRRSLVEDIFQQTWIKVVRNLPGYRDQRKFHAWLCRIAYNLAMNHFRRDRNLRAEELDEALSGDGPDAASRLQDQELEAAVQEAIARLSPEQQEIVRLRLQGLSFKRISELKNLNLNTALGRMHGAVGRLQELLKDFNREAPHDL